MNAVTGFINETKSELKKVHWPTKEQTMQYTMVVIGVSVAVMVFLGALDYLFTFLLNTFIFK